MSWQGYDLLGSFGGESVFLFQIQEAAHVLCPGALCLFNLCFNCPVSVSDWLSCLPLLRPLWLHWAHSDNPGYTPISRSFTYSHQQRPFCHIRQHILRFQGMRMGTSLGTIILFTTGSDILEFVKLVHQIAPYFRVVSAPYFCWNCGNEMVL